MVECSAARDAESFHLLRLVILLQDPYACNRVSAFEVNQVRCGSDPGRLFTRYSPIAEIMQFEINQARDHPSVRARKGTPYGWRARAWPR